MKIGKRKITARYPKNKIVGLICMSLGLFSMYSYKDFLFLFFIAIGICFFISRKELVR